MKIDVRRALHAFRFPTLALCFIHMVTPISGGPFLPLGASFNRLRFLHVTTFFPPRRLLEEELS